MYCQRLAAGLLSFGFAFLGRAYIIDDTNSTIQYSGAVDVMQFLYDPDQGLDNTRIYNATYSDVECRTEDDCHMKIPFVGTGITLYALVWGAVNITFGVDGGLRHSYHNDSCSYPDNPCYNVSTVDVQSLTYGNHTIDVKVFSNNGWISDFNFDYGVINDAKSATVTSSSATITSASASATITVTSPPSTGSNIPLAHISHSNKKTAVAIGGSFGGLAAVAALILVLFYIRKRNRSTRTSDIHPESERNPTPPAFLNGSLLSSQLPPSISSAPVRHHPVEQVTSASPATSEIYSQMTPPRVPTLFLPSDIQESAAIKNYTVAESEAEAEATFPALAASVSVAENTSESIPSLTEPQVVSIQRLLRQNVPGPLVASVMESMLKGEGSSGGNRAGASGAEAPPGYEVD